MNLFDDTQLDRRLWSRIGDTYEVTKKPRDHKVPSLDAIPFANMDSIPQGGVYHPKYIMKSTAEIRSGTYFERGDILVAKITPSFENGKQAIATDLSTPFGYATTEVIPLRPREGEQDPRLLFYYLLHPHVRNHVSDRMEGATGRQRIPLDVLLDVRYPNFPLESQTRIANVLEAVHKMIEVETRSISTTIRLKRAATKSLFTLGTRRAPQKDTEIGTMPQSWSVVALRSLGTIGNGSTPNRSNASYWSSGTYPWLTSSKVYDREVRQADRHVTEQALAECHLPRIPPGAVLIAITGQGKTLGHCTILRIEATINQHLAYVVLDQDRADSLFVRGYLETQYDYLRRIAAGGGSTKGALTCGFLRDMLIPVPPIDEQFEISAVLDAIDRKIDLHRKKCAVLGDLFNALLHNLMTGRIRVADLDLSEINTLLSPASEELT